MNDERGTMNGRKSLESCRVKELLDGPGPKPDVCSSFIVHRSSFIVHRSSFIVHRFSF
jgi:hypothetical protein